MTLRQASSKIRRLLSPHPQASKIKARTVSFQGFGFGSAGFIDIECTETLSNETISQLEEAKSELQNQENKFILSLHGNPYPFGRTI